MTRESGISNRLTPEDERQDRQAHPPKDAPPNTAGDAPNAVAGAFGDATGMDGDLDRPREGAEGQSTREEPADEESPDRE